MSRGRGAGWLPRQHGAWVMVLLPFGIGTALAARAGAVGPGHLALFLTWFLGYLGFGAACLTLRAAPGRRGRSLPAVAVHGTATLAAGVASLLLVGPAVAGWLVAFLPLLGLGLWLAATGRERSLLGGLATVLAASLMLLVTRYPDPGTMAADPGLPLAAGLTAHVFGYFGGTVLYVKTLVRERGSRAWWIASVAWHASWVGLAVVLAGVTGWGWVVFHAATAARAWLLPVFARRRPVPIRAVGFAETGLSAVLLVLALGS